MRRPPQRRRPAAPVRRPERGAALLVVIVSIAILTAIAVDLAYSTRVSLLAAANARDELRAEYLARSGVQLSRIVLKFQQQLDATSPPRMRMQLWSFIPVTDALTTGLFPAGSEAGGGPVGSFDAQLEDEGRKVNAQLDGLGPLAGGQVAAFLQLVGEPRWDPLFDREDEWGQRFTRTDVAVDLHDWTDDDSVTSALSLANPQKPFEPAFGDENQPYSHGDDPYRVKNDRFDSLDELYLVAGIDDAFMTAFGKQLTVYLGKDAQLNVNATDLDQMMLRARIMAPRVPPSRFADVRLQEALQKALSEGTYGGLMALDVATMAGIVNGLVGGVDQSLQSPTQQPNSPFTDRSLVYQIHARGAAGSAERRVDAVLSFDTHLPDPAGTGRLLHWREE